MDKTIPNTRSGSAKGRIEELSTDKYIVEQLKIAAANFKKSEENFSVLIKEVKAIKLELENVKVTNESLVSEIKKLREENIKCNVPVEKSSFAEVTKCNGPVVLIAPKNSNQKSEKTKEIVKNAINPIVNKVSGIRNVAKGGVIVQCSDSSSSEKLQRDVIDNMGEHYNIVIPKRRKPQIKIAGFSDHLSEEKLLECLIEQNEALKEDCDKIKVLNVSEVKNKKYKQYQAVIETDPVIYNKILKQEKLLVNWDRCPVYEYVRLSRCFKCWGFNHFSRECTRNTTCKLCAGDHDSKDCNSVERKCVNCVWYVNNLKLSMDVNHDVFSPNCEVWKRKCLQEKRKIDMSE